MRGALGRSLAHGDGVPGLVRHLILTLAVVLGAALPCGSCSLTSVTDFDLPTCESDADCQPVNMALQERGEIPDGCRPWVCRQARCVDLRELSEREDGDRDLERCDGFDNDCDQIVDEAYTQDGDTVATLAPEGGRVITGVTDVGRVRYGVGESGRAGAAWTNRATAPGRPDQARFALFGEAPQRMTYQTTEGESQTRLRTLDLAPPTPDPTNARCLQRSGDMDLFGRCEFADVAFDVLDERAIAATISTTGCATGQVRAGHFSVEGQPSVVLRGPDRRSNTYLGIDRTADGKCTGASRPACAQAIALGQRVDDPCTTVDDCGGDPSAVDCVDGTCTEVDREATERIRDECGASALALEALEGVGGDREPQALAAWVGDAFFREGGAAILRGECGGDEAPVEVIGLYLDEGSFGETFRWVTGSNEGLPRSLGTTTGGGEPGVTAVADRGYLVGHAESDGSVAVHFVSPAPDLPAYDGYTCCMDPDPSTCTMPVPTPLVTCDGPRDRAGVMTDPLEASEVGRFGVAGGGIPDDISIAPGAVENERVHVGIAWREAQECGPGDRYAPPFRIGFRQLVLRVTGGGVSVEEMGDAVTLASGDGHFGAPSIVRVPSGLVVEGFAPSGGGEAGARETGGWWVAWSEAASASEPGRVLGARVAQVGSTPLDLEPVELTQDLGMVADAVMPGLSRDEDGSPRFAYYDRRNEAVVGGSLTCGVAPTDGGEEE